MIEVTYEVYRFRKWWKNSFVRSPYQGFSKITSLQRELEKEAYKRDLGEIRNLEYKIIPDEK